MKEYTDRKTDGKTDIYADKKKRRERTGRQTDGQRNKQGDIDRPTDRQIHKHNTKK